MEKHKTLTAKEIFCGMPRLREYFRQLDGTIKKFTPEEGKSEGVEILKKKRKDLLEVARGARCDRFADFIPLASFKAA